MFFVLYGTKKKRKQHILTSLSILKCKFVFIHFLFRFIYNHHIIQFRRKLPLELYVRGCNRVSQRKQDLLDQDSFSRKDYIHCGHYHSNVHFSVCNDQIINLCVKSFKTLYPLCNYKNMNVRCGKIEKNRIKKENIYLQLCYPEITIVY